MDTSAPLSLSLLQWLLMGIMVALAILFVLAGLVAIHWLISLPSRRRERARHFLYLLELAHRDGLNPEAVIIDACRSGDTSIPARLHLLAAYLEGGVPLASAMRLIPSLLPTDIRAMVGVGLKAGRMGSVLGPARMTLEEPEQKGEASLTVVIEILLISVFLSGLLMFSCSIVLLPKLRQILVDMMAANGTARFGWLTEFAMAQTPIMMVILVIMTGLLFVVGFTRIVGPRLALVELDALRLSLPWHRQRAHRDFAAILALQLDAGVPEEEALTEAAAATGNGSIQRRLPKAIAALRRGATLDLAVAAIDDRPEFLWRLRNGLAAPGSTVTAMRGWVSQLNASAHRNELIAGQSFAAAMLIAQAILVGAFVCGIFLALITLIEVSANG
jgi:type II secretory pathway component PulF